MFKFEHCFSITCTIAHAGLSRQLGYKHILQEHGNKLMVINELTFSVQFYGMVTYDLPVNTDKSKSIAEVPFSFMGIFYMTESAGC